MLKVLDLGLQVWLPHAVSCWLIATPFPICASKQQTWEFMIIMDRCQGFWDQSDERDGC